MVQAEQGHGIEPVQADGALPRGGARQVPRRSSKASNWIKITAGGIAAAKAIVPAAKAGEPESAGPAIGGEAAAALPIRALVGRVELAMPAGAAGSVI